jgi:hypothetical protein
MAGCSGSASAGLDAIGHAVTGERGMETKRGPPSPQPLWDAVHAQLASNTAERNPGTRTRQPSPRMSAVGSTAEEPLVCTTLRWRGMDSKIQFRGGSPRPSA